MSRIHPYYTKSRLTAARVLIPISCGLAIFVGVTLMNSIGPLWIVLAMISVIAMCIRGSERIILLQKGYWLQKGLHAFSQEELANMFKDTEDVNMFLYYLYPKDSNGIVVNRAFVCVHPGNMIFDYFVYVGEHLFCITVDPDDYKIVHIEYRLSLFE